MLSHRSATLALASLVVASLLVGCSADSSTTPAASSAPRVILVSVDGLRGDGLARMPVLSSLAAQGAWTDSMHTVVPSLTVPGHLAMFTGRDVTAFGVTTNTLDVGTDLALVVANATILPQWAHDAGMRSAAVVGSPLVSASQRGEAQMMFNVDTLATGVDGHDIVSQALTLLASPNDYRLLFVHLPDADIAGHATGWIIPGVSSSSGSDSLAPGYLTALQSIDGDIAQLWAAISTDVAAGRVALVVTSDHGGGHGVGCVAGQPPERQHCTSDPNDVTIPFVMVGAGITPHRVSGHPSITQVAASVAARIGIVAPGGAGAPIQ